MKKKFGDPIHPGEILADELDFLGMNASELATHLGVPKNRIYGLLKGTRNITADTALRLGAFFGMGPRIWLNLQKSYELDVAMKNMDKSIQKIVPYKPASQPSANT